MKRFLGLSVLALSTALFAAASAPVDTGKSKLVASFTQMNVAVEGEFRSFTGSIVYDAANPTASSATLDVNTASFDIGDEEYNAEVRKAEWFDSKTHPVATFKSTTIRALGPDRFEAAGTLALKGKTTYVKAPVTVKTEGSTRRFSGELPISRKAYALGDVGWDEVLEDKVMVRFTIVVPAS